MENDKLEIAKAQLNKFLETGNYLDILPERKGDPRYDKNPIRVEPKVGRNDPCVCGSNLKFKKCCGK